MKKDVQSKFTLVQNDIDGKACMDVFIDYTDKHEDKAKDPDARGYSVVQVSSSATDEYLNVGARLVSEKEIADFEK